MASNLPPTVSAEVVSKVLEALERGNYRLRDDGFRYVRFVLHMTLKGVVEEVIDYLRGGCRLYTLPSDAKKYQGVLRLDDNLHVHFKIDPRRDDEPWFLWLNFHGHNTGYAPLPC